jgi:hypothetical protein
MVEVCGDVSFSQIGGVSPGEKRKRRVPGLASTVRQNGFNWLDCVKSREEPIEPVEVGHSTTNICHCGNIAMRLGRKLQWDPENERFVDDDEANAMLRRPYRAPWSV